MFIKRCYSRRYLVYQILPVLEFGFIWEKIGKVQKGTLELKCHIHYRILQTERPSICNFAIPFWKMLDFQS